LERLDATRDFVDKHSMVFTFGFLAPRKGYITLAKAFNKIRRNYPDSVLVIGGGSHSRIQHSGDYMDFLLELSSCRKLNPQIVLAGHIPETQLPAYLNLAKVGVVPSVNDIASSGSLHQMLGANVPTIASNLATFKELLPKEALFEKGSVESLAKHLDAMLGSPDFREYIRSQERELREKYGWKQIAQRTLELYEEIV